MGLVDLLEARLRLRVSGVHVGVVLARELAVRGLDLLRARVLRDAQGLVVVLVFHRSSRLGTIRRGAARGARLPRPRAAPLYSEHGPHRSLRTRHRRRPRHRPGDRPGPGPRGRARSPAWPVPPPTSTASSGEIEAAGGRGLAFAGDLRDPSVAAGAVAAAVDRFGGLQILVNNAGVGAFSNVADTTDEDWDRVIATNLTAVFRLTRAALPHLAHRGGHVFMISSLAGREPHRGNGRLLRQQGRPRPLRRLAHARGPAARGEGHHPRPRLGRHRASPACPRRRRHAPGCWPPKTSPRPSSTCSRRRDAAHLSRVEMRPARPQKR